MVNAYRFLYDVARLKVCSDVTRIVPTSASVVYRLNVIRTHL